MLICSEKYTYNQAVETLHAMIRGGWVRFELNTEFGRIFVSVSEVRRNKMYRYETTAWQHAPINDETKDRIRDKHIDHYLHIAKVSSFEIQELMAAMSLAECLMRYVTGDEKMANVHNAKYLASLWAKLHRGYSQFNPENLASEYAKTLSPIERLANNRQVQHAVMVDFFRNVMEDFKRTNGKDDKWYLKKVEVNLALYFDTFHRTVLLAALRHYGYTMPKENSEYTDRYNEIIKDEFPWNPCKAIRYIITEQRTNKTK